MYNPLDNPLDAQAVKAPPTPQAPAPNAGFDASPFGNLVNFFAAVPQATFDTGKNLVQSLFRIPAEFGISAAQAGAGIADKILGTDYTQRSTKPVSTEGLAALLGSEPLRGYAPQIEDLASSIQSSQFAKNIGADKHAMPLAFAGIVGGEALNFIGGEENAVKTIAKETDPARIFPILIEAGVDKHAAAQAANHLANTSDPTEIKATLDTLHGMQRAAEVTEPTPSLARSIADQHPDIPYSKVYDIAERATALPETERTPQAIETFVQKEIDSIPEETPAQRIFHGTDNENVALTPVKEGGSYHPGAGPVEFLGPSFSTSADVAASYGKNVFETGFTPKNPKIFKDLGALQADIKRSFGTPKPGDKITDLAAHYRDIAENYRIKLQAEGHDAIVFNEGSKTSPTQGGKAQTVIPITEDFFSNNSSLQRTAPETLSKELPNTTSVGEGTHVPFDKAAQEAAIKEAAAKPKTVIQDKVPFASSAAQDAAAGYGKTFKAPLPPSVGDIITASGKKIPIEQTPSAAIENLSKGQDGNSWSSLVKGYMYNAGPKKTAHVLDYLATPEFVLEKVGLGKGAELLQDAKDVYRTTLKKEFETIAGWRDRVGNNPDAKQVIFQYLDGREKDVAREMTPEEHQVAQEIRTYLQEWAKRLNLPEDKQISRYITHIFERDFAGPEGEAFVDPEMSAIMAENVAKSVYDPFLQKRTGKPGYVEDVWRALDAYVKRASRKEAMDPALEELSRMAKSLDDRTYNYVKTLSHRVNLRPTELEQNVDSLIKQTPLGHYFTDRPVAFLSRKLRQVFYRGTLGLNFSSALRNLTQGANTYAKLGERWTVVGYSKLFSKMVSRDLSELFDQGVLNDELVQDRNIGVTKQALQKLDKGLFSLFEFAEKINRGSAYFGAKAQGLNKGLSEDQAVKYAKRIVRETQFAFGAVDTPVALNDDLVKTVSQLQSYNVKQAEFLGRMLKQKDFVGLLRWTGSSLGMVYTIGRLFGMTPAQLIPTVGLGGSPLMSTFTGIGEAASSDPQTHAKGISQLQRNFVSLFPAGAQIRKTLMGIGDWQQGKDVTPTGRFRYRVGHDLPTLLRAGLFGPSALPQAQEYYDSLGKKKPSTGNPLN